MGVEGVELSRLPSVVPMLLLLCALSGQECYSKRAA
jgi:hypothetical protein